VGAALPAASCQLPATAAGSGEFEFGLEGTERVLVGQQGAEEKIKRETDVHLRQLEKREAMSVRFRKICRGNIFRGEYFFRVDCFDFFFFRLFCCVG
jgi:hypothetical protein